MDKISKIENAIIECLDSFRKSPIFGSLSNKVWTKEIKKRLRNLGRSKFNSRICPTNRKKDFEKEWLL